MMLWQHYLRPLGQHLVGWLGLTPLAYRVAVAGDVRRRARELGLAVDVARNGTITILDPGLPGRVARAVRLAARHAPYAYDSIFCFDYTHGAVEADLQDGVEVVDYSHSKVHRLKPSGDEFRFTGLAEAEATTHAYLTWASLEAGQLVLDLGAYCGGSTVAFARLVGPAGHVFALEPDPTNAAALRENVARHGTGNVTVREAGVWSSTTVLPFAAEGNMGSALTAILPRGTSTARVPVLSLGDVVAEACAASGISRVSFIKMDIEGAETDVLEAAVEVLRLHRPRIAVEPHATPMARRSGAETRARVEAILSGAGYCCTRSTQGTGDHTIVLGAPEREWIDS